MTLKIKPTIPNHDKANVENSWHEFTYSFYVSLAGHLIDLVVVKIQGEQKKKKEMKEISKR